MTTMVRRVNIVKIDAATLDGEPSVALAAAVYDKLGADYPEFVREAAHAVRDPHVVAREAAERLDDARRRLDSERQSLHEIENRRGRLTETVLFESAGSQVDAYARTNRGKIESRLASFGITGDPIANYKSMVRDVADAGGPMGRVRRGLACLLGFRRAGQAARRGDRSFARRHRPRRCRRTARRLAAFSGAGQQGLCAAGGIGSARISAGWALPPNSPISARPRRSPSILLRGVMFPRSFVSRRQPAENDVANRRQAIDQLYAHQTRRVDGLEADVDLAARAAAEADGGLAMRRAARCSSEPSPFEERRRETAGREFLRFARGLSRRVRRRPEPGRQRARFRCRTVFSSRWTMLMRSPPPQARALLEAAHRAFAHNGFVTIDRRRSGARDRRSGAASKNGSRCRSASTP